MGGDASAIHHRIEREARAEAEVVRVGGDFVGGGAPLSLRQGEIVGLAGLEGHGQKALLRAIHEAGRDRPAP